MHLPARFSELGGSDSDREDSPPSPTDVGEEARPLKRGRGPTHPHSHRGGGQRWAPTSRPRARPPAKCAPTGRRRASRAPRRPAAAPRAGAGRGSTTRCRAPVTASNAPRAPTLRRRGRVHPLSRGLPPARRGRGRLPCLRRGLLPGEPRGGGLRRRGGRRGRPARGDGGRGLRGGLHRDPGGRVPGRVRGGGAVPSTAPRSRRASASPRPRWPSWGSGPGASSSPPGS